MEWKQGNVAVEGRVCPDPGYYYCQTGTGGANITLLDDGRWRWQASTTAFRIDMDGDWGFCIDKECAQQCSEKWLRLNDVVPVPVMLKVTT